MNLTLLKKSLVSNLTLKVCSCMLGCWFWFLLSGSHPVSITTEIPVYFAYSSSHYETVIGMNAGLQCIRVTPGGKNICSRVIKILLVPAANLSALICAASF